MTMTRTTRLKRKEDRPMVSAFAHIESATSSRLQLHLKSWKRNCDPCIRVSVVYI